MNPQLLRDLLSRAQSEEMGLAITCNNPQRMTIDLHAVAKDANYDIEIVVPSTPDTVFLVKKSVELDEPAWGEGDLPDV